MLQTEHHPEPPPKVGVSSGPRSPENHHLHPKSGTPPPPPDVPSGLAGGGSRGRGSVGVAQHGVEGAGKVVGQGAAVGLLGQGHQTHQHHQQQEEEVEGEGRPENPMEEGARRGSVLTPGLGSVEGGRNGSQLHVMNLNIELASSFTLFKDLFF